MKNRRAQNATAVQASILWCSHPMPLNHPAIHDCAVALVHIPPGIPMRVKDCQGQQLVVC